MTDFPGSNGTTRDSAQKPTDPQWDLAPGSALHRLTEAQALSVTLIDDLLSASLPRIDEAIDRALARMGEFCGSDRTYLFVASGPDVMANTHEWCAPGIAPMIAELQDLPRSIAEPWWQAFDAAGHVYIPDVQALDAADPLRAMLEVQGIRSLLAVPLRRDGQVFGFLGYDAVRNVRSFLKGEIHLINSVANVIATLLTRRRIEEQIEQARAQQDLERRKLQLTLSALPDLVLELDAELRVTGYHAHARMDLPIPPETLVGLPLADSLPPHVGELARQIQSVLDTDDIAMGYVCPLEMNGRHHWYSVSGARLPPATPGGAPGYLAVIRDVTERQTQRAEIERLSQIARTSTNLIVLTDPAGLIEWVNPAFETRTGYSLAEARGQTPGSLLQCPQTDPETVRKLHDAIAEQRAITCEILNRTKYGKYYWVELAIQPVYDTTGRLTGFMSVQTDTTQHRSHAENLELALSAEQAARSRLKAAVDIMQEAFILFDANRKLVLCNEVYRNLYPQIAPVLVPGTPLRTILTAGVENGCLGYDTADPLAWIDAQIRAFSLRHTRTTIEQKNGRWYRHVQQSTPDGGRIGLLSDITDLKDAEQRALADRARAMDASRDGIALVSPKGVIVYANPAAAQIFAIPSPDQVLGLNWRDLLHDGLTAGGPSGTVTLLNATGFWQGQARVRRQDGTPVDVEISATRNTDGGVLCILRDITEKLHAEAERERLREDLLITRRREEIGLIAMGLTHDLNNLLAAISGAAALIEDGSFDNTKGMAENIGIAVDQASGLLRRLMALGKKRTSSRSPVDLRAPVQDAATLVRAGLHARVQLHVTLPDVPVPALADATAIMQMALNLSINARDALLQKPPADAPAVITVTLAPATGADLARRFDVHALDHGQVHMKLTIADNGPGMDAETLANVFTPYFSTKGERGTGLGVPIAAEVVRDHRGALTIETTPGAGTVFHILLPVDAPAGT